LDKNWCIPVHLKPRDMYNMGEEDVDDFHESEPFEQQNLELLYVERGSLSSINEEQF